MITTDTTAKARTYGGQSHNGETAHNYRRLAENGYTRTERQRLARRLERNGR